MRSLQRAGGEIEISGITFAEQQAVDAAGSLLPDAIVVNLAATDLDVHAITRLTEASPRSRLVLHGERAADIAPQLEDHPWAGELVIIPTSADGGLINAVRAGRVTTRTEARLQPRVITVFSGKGGVGKSTLATNLATALAQECRVLLLDLDLQFGSTSLMATADEGRVGTVLDLVRSDGTIDPRGLADAILDGPGGLNVMYGPMNLETSDLVRPGHVRQLITELRRHFDIVVIDTAPYLEERSLAAIDASDDIVVITTSAVTAAQNARKAMQFLVTIGVPADHIHLVVNQITPKTYAALTELERVIGFHITAALPYAPDQVDAAISSGRPFVLSRPKASISRIVASLARTLLAPSTRQYADRSAPTPPEGSATEGRPTTTTPI